MGCAPALHGAAVASLPAVVDVVPGADPGLVLRALGLHPNRVDPILRKFAGGSRAWLKIQDGCDEHCTFCATTVARGNSRSRGPEDVVAEACALADRHCEIVLTGVHVGAYGADLDSAISLGELLERLVSDVPRVRFRLTSVEATELDDRLVELMREAPDRLAPHVHAPLQSGSDRVLRQMGRHWYTAAAYRARIEWLTDRIPNLGLGADIMVGFPTESEEDHLATRTMIEALPFTYLHVFPYSERSDALAWKLGPPVHPDTWRGRSSELRELARRKAANYRKLQHGRRADVVLLQRAGGRYEGLTEDYLTVFVPADRTPPKRFAAELRLDGAGLKACPVAE
jgi:threonylcarbamoyladenosine tRNA methylthiotransferase MtaB